MHQFQNNLTAVEHVKLEKSAADEQNLLYEQSDLRIEVVELTRLAAIKVSHTSTGSLALFRELFQIYLPLIALKLSETVLLEFFVSINWMKIL